MKYENVETHQKRTLFTKYSSHNYWPISMILTSFVEHAWKIGRIKFQGNPSNYNGEKVEKVLCYGS